jgi:hypothetical protein
MQFSSYKVNKKHRASKPTENASIWTVSEWVEIHLFAMANSKGWWHIDGKTLWAAMQENSRISKIGIDLDNDLYIAKYKCDHNSEWHGYPVHPKDHDIPPEKVLESWREEKLIDKTDKRRIQTGKFCK